MMPAVMINMEPQKPPQDDKRVPKSMPWEGVFLGIVLGLWSFDLAYEAWITHARPTGVSAGEAGLFAILHFFFGSPLSEYIGSVFLFVWGLVCLVLPLYLKLSERGKRRDGQ